MAKQETLNAAGIAPAVRSSPTARLCVWVCVNVSVCLCVHVYFYECMFLKSIDDKSLIN